MPITLKKDVWKVKDPSSGQYRGAAILSTTLPQDAAQIISESNATIQNIKDTAIDAVDTALNDESTGIIPKAEADRDAIDDYLNNATNGIIPTAQANLATIAAAVQSQIGQGTDKTLSVAKGFADAKAAGMMVKVSNYQPGSALDDPATSSDASKNTGYPVYKDSNRVWVKETYAELEVPTMDDHNELKSATYDQSDIIRLKESIQLDVTVAGLQYINYETGGLGSTASGQTFSHTDYVFVKNFDRVRYKRIQAITSSPGFGVAFYDATKTYISGQRALISGSAFSYVDTVINIPENAVFARFTTLNNIELYGAFTVSGVNQLQAQMLNIKDSAQTAAELAVVGNLWDYGVITENVSISPSGGISGNADYKVTDYIPVVKGEIIYGTGARYAFYDENKIFIPGSSYVLANTGIELPNGMVYCSVPSGASYFRICAYKTGVTSFPLYKGSIFDAIALAVLDFNQDYIKKSVYYNNLWRYGTPTYNTALNAVSGQTVYNVNYDTTDYIPVNEGDIIYGYGDRYWFYDSEKTKLSGETGILNTNGQSIGNGMHYVTTPIGASYFRVCGDKTLSTAYKFLLYIISPFESQKTNGTSRKLYCLGDSITRGMFAEAGASSSSGPTPYGYPYWIGQNTGYDVVNLGNSGSGWANIGTAETPDDPSTARNAKDVVDDNEFADADIITMAWGVNDWKGAAQNVVLGDMSSPSGDGTVIGNMKYCIETLVTKRPTSQLIVLLPLNTNRKWSGMRDMTLEENWAFGYPYRNNQTLQDYRTAIRQCAEYYNVKVIDLEEVCPINRLNLRNMCGDGLHPTKAFYKQMGSALANLIC